MTMKEAREKAGMTREEVAKLVQFPVKTITDWEEGRGNRVEFIEKRIISMIEDYANKRDNNLL